MVEVDSAPVLIITNSIAWFLIVFFSGFLFHRIPIKRFDFRRSLFRSFRWEQGGALYRRVFKIGGWKHRIPEAGAFFRGGFAKRSVAEGGMEYLELFAGETCRAELVHWTIIAFLPLFLLWNPPIAVLIMVPLVLALNLPCIMIQRYNRPRLVGLIEKRKCMNGS